MAKRDRQTLFLPHHSTYTCGSISSRCYITAAPSKNRFRGKIRVKSVWYFLASTPTQPDPADKHSLRNRGTNWKNDEETLKTHTDTAVSWASSSISYQINSGLSHLISTVVSRWGGWQWRRHCVDDRFHRWRNAVATRQTGWGLTGWSDNSWNSNGRSVGVNIILRRSGKSALAGWREWGAIIGHDW